MDEDNVTRSGAEAVLGVVTASDGFCALAHQFLGSENWSTAGALSYAPNTHRTLAERFGGFEMSVISGSVGKGGVNRKPDVRAVQCLLNLKSNMAQSGLMQKLAMDGSLGKATQDAIDLYQRKVMKMPNPDGRVDSHGGMIWRLEGGLPLMPAGSFSRPLWLKLACDEEAAGVKEIAGRPSNSPRILEYLATVKDLATVDDVIKTKKADGTKEVKLTGYKLSQVDETAWCAHASSTGAWCRRVKLRRRERARKAIQNTVRRASRPAPSASSSASHLTTRRPVRM
jgi:hypothetical protein